MPSLALVTGISGFLGTEIALLLLERGYRVRGAVRTAAKASAWEDKFKQYKSQLEWSIVPDIAEKGAFDEAIKGVDLVFHVASPFHFSFTDSEKEMIIPARRGVEEIMTAASTEPKVKQVILTSSFAAITSPHHGARPGYTYTEADWNPVKGPGGYEEACTTTDKHFVYLASKTFAEEAAWRKMEVERPHYTLTSLVPPVILGVARQPFSSWDEINQSTRVLWRNIDCKEIPETPAYVCVNVRDCALCHVLAAENPIAAGKRYLTIGSSFTQTSAARIIKKLFPALAPRIPAIPDEEAHYGYSSKLAEEELGIKWTSYEDTIKESVEQHLQANPAA